MPKPPAGKRKTVRSITVDSNVRATRLSPVESNEGAIAGLKTVGMTFTRQQAVHLSTVLLAAAQEWDTITITGYRFDRRKTDGTYHVTVTTPNR